MKQDTITDIINAARLLPDLSASDIVALHHLERKLNNIGMRESNGLEKSGDITLEEACIADVRRIWARSKRTGDRLEICGDPRGAIIVFHLHHDNTSRRITFTFN